MTATRSTERCRQILGELEDAQTAVTRARAKPRGRLRVQMPVAFGQRIVAPLLAEFAQSNPELVIDVELSDRVPDLADEGLDAAVRIGELSDSRLIARRLCDLRFVTVAAPDYLERHGEPKTPDDLDRHRCLAIYIPHTHRYRGWQYMDNGVPFAKTPPATLNMNNAHALLHAAIAGAGIANIPTFTAFDSIRSGLLRPVLRERPMRGTAGLARLPRAAAPLGPRAGLRGFPDNAHPVLAGVGRDAGVI